MQLELKFPGPPNYRIRRSGRARRPSVTVCPHDGVVLTLPPRFDERHIPALLAEWRPWIDRQLRRFDNHRASLPPDMTDELPAGIRLPAMGRAWQVDYPAQSQSRAQVREAADRLVVRGDGNAARDALCRWLARKARGHLEPELAHLAERYDLRYRKLTIRGQRTCWGSCSSTGTISLNYLLMFLSADAARAVIVHELCHTRYMSHGPRFYGLLDRLEPRHRELDREVRDGWRHIPAWAWPRRQKKKARTSCPGPRTAIRG